MIDSQLFNSSTDLFELFLNNINQNTDEFKKIIRNFHNLLILKKHKNLGVHGNEDLIHSAINYVALQIKNESKFGKEIWYKK